MQVELDGEKREAGKGRRETEGLMLCEGATASCVAASGHAEQGSEEPAESIITNRRTRGWDELAEGWCIGGCARASGKGSGDQRRERMSMGRKRQREPLRGTRSLMLV